MGNKTMNTQNH